jgi:predicted ester cyclase
MMSHNAPVEGFSKISQVGPEDCRGFVETIWQHISNVRISMERHVQEGQWSSAVIFIEATNIMTGEPVTFSGQVFARIFDNKIIEGYNHIDFITLFEQLGQLPPDSIGRCLSGEVLK